jgi:hypothetical protein
MQIRRINSMPRDTYRQKEVSHVCGVRTLGLRRARVLATAACVAAAENYITMRKVYRRNMLKRDNGS